MGSMSSFSSHIHMPLVSKGRAVNGPTTTIENAVRHNDENGGEYPCGVPTPDHLESGNASS